MKFYNYIPLNIKSFWNTHKGMFILMMCSEIAAVICLLFSYGLFLNTRQTSGELKDDQRTFSYNLCSLTEDGDTDYSSAQDGMKTKLDSLTNYLGKDFDSLTLYLKVTDKTGELHSATCYYTPNEKDTLFSGKNGFVCNASNTAAKTLGKNGFITLDGTKYEINKTDDYNTDFIMPYSALTDKSLGVSFTFMVTEQPTKEKIDSITEKCYEIFGVSCSAAPEASQLLTVQINNMFYLYSAVITLIVVINLSLYFKYIFKTKKHEMYIFKLCGGTSKDISRIFTTETMIELIVGFVIGLAAFHNIGLTLCAKIYPNFKSYYSPKVYIIVFAIYLLVSWITVKAITDPYVKKLLK